MPDTRRPQDGSTMYTSEEDLERPKRLPRRGGAPPLPAAACGVLGVSHNAGGVAGSVGSSCSGFHQCRQRWMELVAQHGDSEARIKRAIQCAARSLPSSSKRRWRSK